MIQTTGSAKAKHTTNPVFPAALALKRKVLTGKHMIHSWAFIVFSVYTLRIAEERSLDVVTTVVNLWSAALMCSFTR